MSDRSENRRQWLLLGWRAVVVVALLVGGTGLMRHLKSKKKPPVEVVGEANVPIVDVVALRQRAEPVTLSGYGVVRAGRLTEVAPEVGGRIIWRAALEIGDQVVADAPLVRIDARDHEAALAASNAQLQAISAEIRQWEAQLASAKVLLKQRRERAELSAAEAKRLARLWETQKIGTQSAVDAAKRLAVTDLEAVTATEELLAVTPHRIAAAEANASRIENEMALTKLRIERCEVRSPYAGRVVRFGVELGAYATPGMVMVAISDDADREIPVALRADEVNRFLPFSDERVATADGGWYVKPSAIEVTITDPASSADNATSWPGTVERIASVDPGSRMVEIVVKPASGGAKPLPVGTFCEVRIPGKPVEAFRIPRVALRSGGKVFVAEEGRLDVRPVTVAHVDGDWLLVNGKLADGERLILGRLMAPVTGMAISVRTDQPAAAQLQSGP